MIVARYLRSKFGEFGGERVVHIGGAWHWDGGASGAFVWFDDAVCNYRLWMSFGKTREKFERGGSDERYRYPRRGGA